MDEMNDIEKFAANLVGVTEELRAEIRALKDQIAEGNKKPPKTMLRAEFDRVPHLHRMSIVKAGTIIV